MKKFLLLIFVVTLFLIFSEMSLRVAGSVYYKIWNDKEEREIQKGQLEIPFAEKVQSSAGLIRILCLGDSWTFGTGAPPGYSYPAQLQKIFDKEAPGNYKVYNSGIPGITSTKLLKYFPYFLKKSEPDIVVVMVGMNDVHNPYFSEISELISPHKNYYEIVKNFFEDLRLYKIVKLGLDSMIQKAKKSKIPVTFDKEKIINSLSLEYSKEAIDLLNKGEIRNAIKFLNKAVTIDDANQHAYIELAHCYDMIGDYAKCLLLFEKALKLNLSRDSKEQIYRHLFRIYQHNSPVKDKIFVLLKGVDRDYPFNNQNFPFLIEKSILEKKLQNNLKKMLDLTQSQKGILIFQIYPVGEGSEVAKALKEKFNLTIVDNAALFKETNNINDYFDESIRHPNEKGYYLIATNVYKTIKNTPLGDIMRKSN